MTITSSPAPHGADGEERERQILAWARAVKAGAPELLIFEDLLHAAPQKSEVPEMFEICDIICPGRSAYAAGGKAAAEFYESLRRGGRALWFYSATDPSRSALVFRRQQWSVWKARGTGTGYWSYGDAGGIGNSWNQIGAKRMIYSPLYIDSHSVTDGKQWLAIIEGRQDYEYLHMLQDKVQQLGDAGQTSTALTRARQLLAVLPDEVIGGDLTCDQGRMRVLDTLLELAQ